jgi:hypothetical protein
VFKGDGERNKFPDKALNETISIGYRYQLADADRILQFGGYDIGEERMLTVPTGS